MCNEFKSNSSRWRTRFHKFFTENVTDGQTADNFQTYFFGSLIPSLQCFSHDTSIRTFVILSSYTLLRGIIFVYHHFNYIGIDLIACMKHNFLLNNIYVYLNKTVEKVSTRFSYSRALLKL